MQAISLRLPDPLFFDLMAQVKASAQTQTDIIREAIREYLQNKTAPQPKSAAALAARFSGTCDGPSDLATNPQYMAGFGR